MGQATFSLEKIIFSFKIFTQKYFKWNSGRKTFFNALIYVKFFPNFSIKIVGDILKNVCFDTSQNGVKYRVSYRVSYRVKLNKLIIVCETVH